MNHSLVELETAIEAHGGHEAMAKRVSSVARVEPDDIILARGTSIRPEPIDWLWPGWLARGKLHILAGASGQGKTTIALALAARLTVGGHWPDGTRCEAASVLIWSSEDDPADTLMPRLLAMGADPARTLFVIAARIDGKVQPFDPARDMLQLAATAERVGDVGLLVIDPVVSAVAGDSHKNTEVRRALQPLVDLGASIGAAVLGITHFTKGSTGRDPTERVVGSMAFGAVARVVMAAAKVRSPPGDEDRRVLVRSKSNIGPDGGGFEYRLEQRELDAYPGIVASCVDFGQAVDGTALELLAQAESESGQDDGEDGVEGFLRSLLADGPVPASQLKRDADGAGYGWRTVQRAAHRMGVEKRKYSMKGGWVWALATTDAPGRRHEGAEDVSVQNVSPSASSMSPSDDAEDF